MSPHKTPAAEGRSSSRNWLMGAEAFEARMPHHDGIQALWETKWKFPVSSDPPSFPAPSNKSPGTDVHGPPQCTKSLYPFHDGKFEDFEPIFLHLIEVCTLAAPGPR